MSSTKYIDDLIEGCSLMTDIISMIGNMKKLKIGCIPFNLEIRIQEILEWAYSLIENSKDVFNQIQIPQERFLNPVNPKPTLPELFKNLLKKIIQYLDLQNKNQSSFTLIENHDQIEQTLQEIQNIPKLVVPVSNRFLGYANDFREYAEVLLFKLNIISDMFPLE